MSELTSCNYCDLRWLRKDVPPGHHIVVRPAGDKHFPKAVEVYVLPDAVELPEGELSELSPHFVAWMAELTEQCEC